MKIKIKFIAGTEQRRDTTNVWINYGSIIRYDLINRLKPVTVSGGNEGKKSGGKSAAKVALQLGWN